MHSHTHLDSEAQGIVAKDGKNSIFVLPRFGVKPLNRTATSKGGMQLANMIAHTHRVLVCLI